MFGRNRRDEWWQRQLDRERQQAAAERRELLDRIMVLSGNPWTLPPSVSAQEEPVDDDPQFDENALHGAELDY